MPPGFGLPMALPLQFLLTNALRYTLMAKDKKKRSKKDPASENIMDAAALSLKKFRKVTKQIGKLSTGQKLAGGAALLAAGLVYLANRDGPAATPAQPAPGPPAADADAAAEADAPADAPAPRKARKSLKHKPSAERD